MRIVVITWLLVSPFALHTVAEDTDASGDAILRFTYVVKDAPVWTAKGEFDPAVLVKLIEASIDFGHDTPETSLRIHPIPETGALSVRTTVDAHRQIWKLLKEFPAVAKAWGPGKPDYAQLLKAQAERTQRAIELDQLLRKKHLIDAARLRR